jgi:hypothetical protein
MRTDCRLPDYQVQGTWLREFTGWGGKVAIVRGKCGLGKVANVDLDKISRHRQVQTQRFGLSAEISQEIAEEIPHEMRKIPHGIFTIFWTMIGALKKIRAGRRRFFCALTRHREDGSDVKSKITNKNPIFTAKVTIPKNVFYQYLKKRKSWYVTFLYLALIQIFRIRLYTAIKYKRV